uniref:tRNA-5-taurinomethyluridine 2-sulfurtransferase n=1 Tax=Panagrolaimus sp. ES5 TaxID=591445 RepID=A0AC34G2E3_9BILA
MVKKKVICAISGGIDSAVSAFLLKRRGFDVHGLFMTNWDHAEEEGECSRTKDFADAERICRHLNIELHSVNFVKEYWNEVFLPLIESYKQGKAVVPDVGCNAMIKFGTFYKFAFESLKADAVATGHYARTSFGDFLESKKSDDKNEKCRLLRAKDSIKDQTYFLANVSGEKLGNTMFPVGSLLKSQVQKIAAQEGLNFLLKKKESMGICFVGKRKSFPEFLTKYIEPQNGEIILASSGKIIGKHSGVFNFTLGKRISVSSENYLSHDGLFVSKIDPINQRLFVHSGVFNFTLGKRISVSSENYQSHDGLFVSKIDPINQRLFVCEGSQHPSLFARSFQISSPFWISEPRKEKLEFALQRNQPLLECKLTNNNLVIPNRPVRAAALGQMCVFYDGEICLGGGEIDKIISTLES